MHVHVPGQEFQQLVYMACWTNAVYAYSCVVPWTHANSQQVTHVVLFFLRPPPQTAKHTHTHTHTCMHACMYTTSPPKSLQLTKPSACHVHKVYLSLLSIFQTQTCMSCYVCARTFMLKIWERVPQDCCKACELHKLFPRHVHGG